MKDEITLGDILEGTADLNINDMWAYIKSEMKKNCRIDQTWEDAFFSWDKSSIAIMKDKYNLSYEVIGNLVLGAFIKNRPDDANRFFRLCQSMYEKELSMSLNSLLKKEENLKEKITSQKNSRAGKKNKKRKAFDIVSKAWNIKPTGQSTTSFVAEMMEEAHISESTVYRYLSSLDRYIKK